MTEVSLRELLQQLAEERNLDLRGYKITSLERRFRHRMFQLRIDNYGEYADYIRENPSEVNDLLNAVLINVTQFFRDPPAWEILRKEILPDLAVHMHPGETFRAWSAGCASGEETYSLAILLAEQFGPRLKEYDIKVYGTDVDDDALNIARRGEYHEDKLRHVRPEWREKYFHGEKICRVSREVRRVAIFGRSNLAFDAPISHVNLLLCRNLLIYFDLPLQRQILSRLHYALEPGGVLMLGKSESQLSQSSLFTVLNAKWRIFLRRELDNRERAKDLRFLHPRGEDPLTKTRQDYGLLKLYHDALLQTLEPGVLVVDPRGVVISDNEATRHLWGLNDEKIAGKPLAETPIAARCPELLNELESLRSKPGQTARFEVSLQNEQGEHQVSITLKPVASETGAHVATLVYAEDISPRQKLQHTVEELETTSEELQSTNEELETTNEELQSTNEELETTNEELQSTNEELETTNEELQALNEELGTTNEELEVRSKELDELNLRYSETLEKMPWPIALVADEGRVQFWNAAAARLFGLAPKSVIGLQLKQLPFEQKLRELLVRNYRDTLGQRKVKVVHNCHVDIGSFLGDVNIQFTPLLGENTSGSVIIVFEPFLAGSSEFRRNRRTGVELRAASEKKQESRKRSAKAHAKKKGRSRKS
jgi:two-component system CheB/CheR fusion protein